MMSYLNINWKKSVVLLTYPLLLAFVLEITLQEWGFSSFPNLLENILFLFIVLLVINQLAVLKFGRRLVNLVIILYYAFLFIETGLYLLFQTRLNAAYVYVMFNTHYGEVSEFSSVYYKHSLNWLLLFFIPLFGSFSKKVNKQAKFKTKGLVYSSIIILIILSVLKYSNLIKWNLPYVTFKSYYQYQKQLKAFSDFNNEKIDIKTKLVTENDAIVVIVGESTTSKHMGIYGYPRNTTPRLNTLSESLIIYKNVISSHVYTTASIYDIFTLANYENSEVTVPVINYLKNAGYEVFWLSNQRPVGLYDNLVSRLASAANESLFLSYNDFRHNTSYDEVLLPILEEKLLVKGKKVIFLHLIGSHYDYKKRYPIEFNKFSSENKSVKNKMIDQYDNAILYNDSIVAEIVKIVSKKDEKSAVLYFSDHGEELFDVSNYFGHFSDKPTSTMYEVPFLVYMSPTFEKPNDFIIDESRAYMLDDFSHSLTHFMGIESELLEKSRSVFSKSFKARKRIVQDSVDFKYFKSKEK